MNGQSAAVPPRFNITASTGVSIGIMIVLVGATFTVMSGINSIHTEIAAVQTKQESNKMEFMAEVEKIKTQVNIIQSNKSAVTTTQFFKWAVHLQQANPQIKVPEPEVDAR